MLYETVSQKHPSVKKTPCQGKADRVFFGKHRFNSLFSIFISYSTFTFFFISHFTFFISYFTFIFFVVLQLP